MTHVIVISYKLFVIFLLSSYQFPWVEIFYNSTMMSPEHVGTQNKLIPYDIKVGIACTSILFEGGFRAGKPAVQFGLHEVSRKGQEAQNRRILDLRTRRMEESLRKGA
jgi:hypothetical protein